MKKIILSFVTMAVMATSFQTQAGVGLIPLLFGKTAIALTGLKIAGVSFVISALDEPSQGFGCMTAWGCAALAGTAVGLVILDGEEEQEIELVEVSEDKLLESGLSESEAQAYNDNVEELNIALTEVIYGLNEDSTSQDAEDLWNEQREIIGDLPVNALRKLISYNLK